MTDMTELIDAIRDRNVDLTISPDDGKSTMTISTVHKVSGQLRAYPCVDTEDMGRVLKQLLHYR